MLRASAQLAEDQFGLSTFFSESSRTNSAEFAVLVGAPPSLGHVGKHLRFDLCGPRLPRCPSFGGNLSDPAIVLNFGRLRRLALVTFGSSFAV